ncbi:HEAT repeat domain-containing protein [Aspergillus fijiensis CBS 313.89]|uniref:ARM repeat-containing protein n=1 Tax=Aspergillus fijiensis CBS 313.89 TaxID=1448319 RepID=A0A8G1VTK9_9EURO|nr:ARM repeat-containing protein [Aspergillus fijiensis CBS 313.89]RAK72197.1 ARM repeat-containing protein [Aspergillus fijiensis CBS 313.89]
MTTIYQAICVELLRKDLWRREKRIDGRTLTEQQTEELSEFEVQLHMQEEINLLEALAFHGLVTKIIDFDAPVRSQIYQHLLNGNVLVPRLHESTIKEISFLRSSDATDNAQQSFHFLHLTVQDLMAREKYNVRYEVFWRFVAGFLGVGYNHQKQSEEHTAAFLEAMENKPRDMLGPMHSKLMMRLWSEVPASNNIARLRSLRQSHYQRLARWSSCEVTAYDKGELAGEAEYPDAVLSSLLKDRSSDVRRHVLNVIAQRRVSTSVTDLIASWVDQVSDDELNPVFVRTLLRNCRSLSPKAHEILLVHLHDESKVEESDFRGVQVPALPQDLLRAILDCLHYGAAGLKAAALEILSDQPPSALQAYVDTIAHGLSDPESQDVTSKSLKILERLDLSLEILQSMTYLVYKQIGSYPSPFDIVKKSLCRHSLVSPSILGYVCSLLDHRSFIVRKLAVRVLAQHPLLSPSTADWLDQEVHLGDCLVKDLRTTVWQQLLPSQNIREDIVRRLKHIDPAVRGVAALILGGRSDLSNPTFEAVAELLSDTKWSVREAAAKALRGQSELPHHVLDQMAGLLEDHHPLVRYQAIKTLTKYPDDELKYLDDMVLSLEDPDLSVAYKASEAMRKHPKVPRELLYHLFAQMIDPQDHHTTRFDPIFRNALRRGLPLDLGNRLLDLAESADIEEGEGEGDVEHILDLLGAQPFLPPGKLLQLSERFVTSDDRIASAVVKILVAQAHLPPPLILALTRFLDRADKTLVLDVTIWLLGQSELPLEALALMAGMLPTVPLPGFAANVLSRQPPLPSEIMNLALSAFRLATDKRYAEIHEVLERNDAFYRMLPQLPVHDLQRLCRVWLRRSFGERVNFYFRDEFLVVDTPDFQGAIPMALYQRIKLRLIFRLTVVACTRASEIEQVRSRIRGSVAWMRGHRALVLAFVAAFLAVILRWALW